LPLDDEKNMELSGELARNLLNAAPDPTVIVDGDGVIVFANARLEEIFGHEAAQLINQPIEMLLPERFRTEHARYRDRFFKNPKPRPMGAGLELYGLHRNGQEIPVEISLSPLQTPSGLLVSSAIRDISDRKAIENALVAARNEADSANRAKSAFLAAASHDLRQPMQTLSLLNTALSRAAEPGSRSADIAVAAAVALSSMAELLNALLDISKLEAGAVKPDVEDCSVQRIFERLQTQFAAQAEAKGLKLLVDDCDDVVHTDPTLLEQIVQNLLANAIRYTKRGKIRLRCLHENAFVRIDVLDTGIGIPGHELQSIFEEFYQAPREKGERREGLGLGLSIVRRVADLLDIRLEVQSTPGRGSRFSLDVPRGVLPSAAEPPVSAQALLGHGRDGLTVLVIDDDYAVADATALLLEVEGYRPYVAASLNDARARIGELLKAPDLIICDYQLGSSPNGVETIRVLRSLSKRPIPALLVTGDTSSAALKVGGQLEDCGILSKPIDGAKLLALLNALGHRAEHPAVDDVAPWVGNSPEASSRNPD
jgi:PAS domain S-box-containing protein